MRHVTLSFLFLAFVAPGNLFAQEADETAQQRLDRMVVAVQQICPISGNKLGDHGDPIKVKIGEEELFVCCRGCLDGEVNRDHWATIHSNFAKAQGICPVMEKEIPASAKWTVVNGRIFYVCCPPCTDKIEEKPEEYLGKLTALYEASLNRRR